MVGYPVLFHLFRRARGAARDASARRRRPRADERASRTTGDLSSFVRAAAARALVREALRATSDLADVAARRELRREIVAHARRAEPVASMGKADGAFALSEGRRRLKELREMLGMVL